jgi:hypothetical protein
MFGLFESSRRLNEDIAALLDAVRHVVDGRYACLMEPGRILLETPTAEGDLAELRRLIEANGPAIFGLPAAMADEENGPAGDPFEGWTHDELCLVVVNDKVALLAACPDAEAAREDMMPALRALVDRLLRLERRYRTDRRGRGLFFGSPRLDFVVIGGAESTTPQ